MAIKKINRHIENIMDEAKKLKAKFILVVDEHCGSECPYLYCNKRLGSWYCIKFKKHISPFMYRCPECCELGE